MFICLPSPHWLTIEADPSFVWVALSVLIQFPTAVASQYLKLSVPFIIYFQDTKKKLNEMF